MSDYFETLAKVHNLAFRHNLPVEPEEKEKQPSPDIAADAKALRRNLGKDFIYSETGKNSGKKRLNEYSARILAKAGFVFIPLIEK